MPSLHFDLVFDILSRLPGKTLAKFRCVSKGFNSLISDHQFLRLHHRRSLDSLFALHALSGPRLRRSQKFDVQLFLTDDDNVLLREFVEQFDDPIRRIYPSYHQLLCFHCHDRIFLCNPIRRQFLTLPNSPSGFDLSDNFGFGFGFVSSTMQYKAIRWLRRNQNSNEHIDSEILTISVTADGRLEISPWRSLEFHCTYLLESSCVHVNGDLFWKTSDFRIVLFSLQDERFSPLQSLPPCFDQDKDRDDHLFDMAGIRRNLHVIDYDVLNPAMEIWVLSDRKSCRRTKIYQIELGGTPGFWPGRICSVFSISVLDIRSEWVLFQLLYPFRMKCYYAETNSVEDLGEVTKPHQLCHYTDGLLSLDNVVFR